MYRIETDAGWHLRAAHHHTVVTSPHSDFLSTLCILEFQHFNHSSDGDAIPRIAFWACIFFLNILLTVYLNIFISYINQLDALNFIKSLFQASTCFEHLVLIVRRAKLYYTVSGIITPIGGRPVHRTISPCAPDGHLQV